MKETVTLELPSDLVQSARAEAGQSHKRIEDVLVDWLYRARTPDTDVESLSDADVLALCDSQMQPADQEELSELLDDNRERALSSEGRVRLNQLMDSYRRALLRKAKAWKVAVERGLRDGVA
ncbi:MAG TPA: hypothetical protein VKS79_21610 [Gemmataceae bacterium]|nr:hypothetical protein [Gemmataceae bacterium]